MGDGEFLLSFKEFLLCYFDQALLLGRVFRALGMLPFKDAYGTLDSCSRFCLRLEMGLLSVIGRCGDALGSLSLRA